MSYQLPATVSMSDELIPVLEDPQEGLRRSFRMGLITIGILIFGLFALSALIGTRGAVVGSGEVTVASRVKKIAHPTGGVIAAVNVREGQRVKKGDVLMRLDDTVAGASAWNARYGLSTLEPISYQVQSPALISTGPWICSGTSYAARSHIASGVGIGLHGMP